MARRYPLIVGLVFALVAPAASAQTNVDTGTIEIMRPEPQTPPLKHKARRGSSNPVYPTPLPAPEKPVAVPRLPDAVPRARRAPPPIYVPQTGQLLPNLPMISGSGPGGSETSQDRAMRCAHQAGVYGEAAGDRNAYVGRCVNQ